MPIRFSPSSPNSRVIHVSAPLKVYPPDAILNRRVVSTGSVIVASYLDMNVSRSIISNYITDYQIQNKVFGGIGPVAVTYSSSNSSIATVNSSGFVSHVSDGTATIFVSASNKLVSSRLTFSTVVGETVDSFINYKSESVSKHVSTYVDNKVSVVSSPVGLGIFSVQDHANSRYVRNPECWMYNQPTADNNLYYNLAWLYNIGGAYMASSDSTKAVVFYPGGTDPAECIYSYGHIANTDYYLTFWARTQDGSRKQVCIGYAGNAARLVINGEWGFYSIKTQVDLYGNLTMGNYNHTIPVDQWTAQGPWNLEVKQMTFTLDKKQTDISCLSPWNSTSGQFMAGTLVSPRHIIFAAHYQLDVGATVRFVKMDGTVVERTMTAKATPPQTGIYYPDVTVGLLDSDVPSDVEFAKVLPPYTNQFFPTINASLPGSYLPSLTLDAEEKALVTDLYSESSTTFFTIPSNLDRRKFYEDKIGGDSGNPALIVVNNTPVLLTVWTFGGAGSGTSIRANTPLINAIMSGLQGGFGSYQLKYVDLSSFKNYQYPDILVSGAGSSGFNGVYRRMGDSYRKKGSNPSINFVISKSGTGSSQIWKISQSTDEGLGGGGSSLPFTTERYKSTNGGPTDSPVGLTFIVSGTPAGDPPAPTITLA